MIVIKNLKTDYILEYYDVRVDRKSILGSPFYISKNNTREEVLAQYKTYFKSKVKNDPKFKKKLDQLFQMYIKYGRLNLFCWCAPKPCHAETIRDYLLRRRLRKENK